MQQELCIAIYNVSSFCQILQSKDLCEGNELITLNFHNIGYIFFLKVSLHMR